MAKTKQSTIQKIIKALFSSSGSKKGSGKGSGGGLFGTLRKKNVYEPPKVYFKKTVQDSIPILAVHEKENLIETYENFFTRSYWIGENNYQSETESREQDIYLDYRKILNSIGIHEEYSISMLNRNVDMREVEENVLKKETGDEFDFLRRELNSITLSWLQEGRDGLEKLKYITIGLHCDSLQKAQEVFDKSIDRRMEEGFKKVESFATPISIDRKLEILHDIYNPDDHGSFLTHKKIIHADTGKVEDVTEFDMDNMRAQGCTIKDIIGPSSFVVYDDHIEMGRKYVRVLRVEDLSATMSDEVFCELTDVDFNVLVTTNYQPLSNTIARGIVSKNLALARSEVADQRKELLKANLPEDMVSDEKKENMERAEKMRKEMVENDERLFKVVCTVVIFADSADELRSHTETILTYCQGEGLTVRTMELMQEEGFNTTLPLLDNELPYSFKRTMKSSSAAIYFPFSNLELNDPGGINYSCNMHSKNLLVYNRLLTQNFNGFVLAKPGAGKSFFCKVEMLNVFLGSNADCIVIDPEGEYAAMTKLIHGQVIKIESGGANHINPMEISMNYEWAEEDDVTISNPVFAKVPFIIQLVETMVDPPLGSLTATQKSIIDECVRRLYEPFMSNGVLRPIPPEKMPTLTDLQHEFAKEYGKTRDHDAKELADALKLFTGSGTLNTFGFQSNVDINNRFVTFDIRDADEVLKPLAMMIIFDSLFHRMFTNKKLGRHSWIWCDEFHMLMTTERSALTLEQLFRRARKFGGVPTGITQNVKTMLSSVTGCSMLSNCNFVVMLNNEKPDREELQSLFNLSESQMNCITAAPKGQGLIYTGTHAVPFASTFPKGNSIYRCITSNMVEIREYEEEERRRKTQEAKSDKKKLLAS